jgi:hypothetical protein
MKHVDDKRWVYLQVMPGMWGWRYHVGEWTAVVAQDNAGEYGYVVAYVGHGSTYTDSKACKTKIVLDGLGRRDSRKARREAFAALMEAQDG